MAYYDHTDNARHSSNRTQTGSPSALATLAAALGVIVAIGVLGQIAGDWTDTAAARMSAAQPAAQQITDWHGNSASLPSGR